MKCSHHNLCSDKAVSTNVHQWFWETSRSIYYYSYLLTWYWIVYKYFCKNHDFITWLFFLSNFKYIDRCRCTYSIPIFLYFGDIANVILSKRFILLVRYSVTLIGRTSTHLSTLYHWDWLFFTSFFELQFGALHYIHIWAKLQASQCKV